MHIEQYKRFREPAVMDVDPSLVCIVGPNAAGKSSFLDALVHLNHDDPFDPRETTRALGGEARPTLRAQFVLGKDDRAAIEHIPEAKSARQLTVIKKPDGSREYGLEPVPARDLGPRSKAGEKVAKLKSTPWVRGEIEREQTHGSTELADQLGQVQTILDTKTGALDATQIEQVRWMGDRLKADGAPATQVRLAGQLLDLTKHEARDPYQEALNALVKLVPAFEKFDDSSRELQASYDVNTAPDLAVRNLLTLAGTSFAEAQTIAADGDPGRKVSWLERTNQRLAEAITKAWNQSDLTVYLDLDGTTLSVLMTMHEQDYVQIDQHSDGLRQFVALRAFVAIASGAVKPIILIDEADTHLHYDAQADLVRVLEEQQEAAKVIYTTHSAGCLPRDLGTGVRAIVPVYTEDTPPKPTDDSAVRNHFWTADGHGFSPLLLAMGASAFAFAATQRAVIAEGMSDVLLYPTLIREARGADHVGYQITPSFAEASREEIPKFDLLAARVAFAADGDEGGRAHAKKLEAGGVIPEQITFLGGPQSGLSVEDLLDKGIYRRAVNDELSRWYDGVEIPEEAIPDVGRSRGVADWCAAQPKVGGRAVELSKVRVAERVLDYRFEHTLLAPARKGVVKSLDKALTKILDTATTRLSA